MRVDMIDTNLTRIQRLAPQITKQAIPCACKFCGGKSLLWGVCDFHRYAVGGGGLETIPTHEWQFALTGIPVYYY
jgi:hypothetical protein